MLILLAWVDLVVEAIISFNIIGDCKPFVIQRILF